MMLVVHFRWRRADAQTVLPRFANKGLRIHRPTQMHVQIGALRHAIKKRPQCGRTFFPCLVKRACCPGLGRRGRLSSRSKAAHDQKTGDQGERNGAGTTSLNHGVFRFPLGVWKRDRPCPKCIGIAGPSVLHAAKRKLARAKSAEAATLYRRAARKGGAKDDYRLQWLAAFASLTKVYSSGPFIPGAILDVWPNHQI
jgi:hypothetical protein